MKGVLLEFLNDLKGVGKHASRSEIGEVFDAHFQDFVVTADSYSGVAMTSAAQERGMAALLERTIGGKDSIIANSPPVWRSTRALALAAGVALLIALSVLYVLRWNNASDGLAIPSPSPKAPSLGGPIPDRPIPDPDSPIVKDEPKETRQNQQYIAPPKPGIRKQEPILASNSTMIGVFANVEGEPILFNYGSSVGERIRKGTKLNAGARIVTRDTDKATYKTVDGSVISVEFNTEIAMPDPPLDPANSVNVARSLELRTGLIAANIVSTPDKQPFTIKTPVASAQVMGTSFKLSVEKMGPVSIRAVLMVTEGRVRFFNEIDSVTATEMTESSAQSGSAPTDPKRIRTLRDFVVYNGSRHSHIRHETAQLDEEAAQRKYIYPLGWAGFTVANLPNGGVRVSEIYTDGPARRFGLRVDDLITSVDGQPVVSAETVNRAIAMFPRRGIELGIDRNGQRFFVRVTTSMRGPRLPEMSASEAELLSVATWPAMSGKPEVSERLFREMLADSPTAPVHNNLAVILETRDEMGEAIKHFKEAVRLDPNEGQYRLNLAAALQKVGNLSRSIEEAEEAIEIDPYLRSAVFFLADAYAFVDRYDEAITVLREAAGRLPLVPRFWMRMSRIHVRSRDFDAAIRTAERAVELDPQNQLTQLSLATALVYGERYEEAIGWYEKAIEISPAQAFSYADMAIALEHLGRLDEAETALRDAVERAPRATRIRHQLGQFLARRQRYKEAEAEFRLTINLDRGMVLAIADLGLTLLELGEFEEAETQLRNAIKIDPHYAHGHGYLGKVLLLSGRNSEAEQYLRTAIDIEPEDVNPYIDMGLVYEANKDLASAVTWYRRALVIEPGNETAAEALKRIIR